jgi:hypothetical protein
MSAITGTLQTPLGDVDVQDALLYVVVLEEDGKPVARIGGRSASDHDWVSGTLRRLAVDADRQSRRAQGAGR